VRLREYLGQYKKALAEVVAKGSGRPFADVDKEYGDLASALEAFDRIEVNQSAAEGTLRITVRIEFVKPLK
jgi:hypothetical protein